MIGDLQVEFPNLNWEIKSMDNELIICAHDDGSGLGVYVSEDGVLDGVWNLHVYNQSYNVLCKSLGNKEKIIKSIKGFLKHPPVSFTKYILKDITGSINKLKRVANTDPNDEVLDAIKSLNKLKKRYTKLGKEYGVSKYTKGRRAKRSSRKINY